MLWPGAALARISADLKTLKRLVNSGPVMFLVVCSAEIGSIVPSLFRT